MQYAASLSAFHRARRLHSIPITLVWTVLLLFLSQVSLGVRWGWILLIVWGRDGRLASLQRVVSWYALGSVEGSVDGWMDGSDNIRV